VGLGGQKLTPGRAVPPGRGIDAGLLQDLSHGRMGDLVAQPNEFALDPPVSPPRHPGRIPATAAARKRTSGSKP
jgi:hypothetical protein